MEKIHKIFIYKNNMKTKISKTKLTISIDKNLLELFDSCCEHKSINKSKLVSSMIKQWCQDNKS